LDIRKLINGTYMSRGLKYGKRRARAHICEACTAANVRIDRMYMLALLAFSPLGLRVKEYTCD
jgi:hypothetical protein